MSLSTGVLTKLECIKHNIRNILLVKIALAWSFGAATICMSKVCRFEGECDGVGKFPNFPLEAVYSTSTGKLGNLPTQRNYFYFLPPASLENTEHTETLRVRKILCAKRLCVLCVL